MVIDLAAIALACAPFIDQRMTMAIIHVESRGNALAINVNASKSLPRIENPKPKTKHEAIQISQRLIDQGYSVDMGLMQINSGNLKGLGIRVEQLFDPCSNMYVGGTVLWRFHRQAVKELGAHTSKSITHALSGYNTGNFRDGYSNGYVNSVVNALNTPYLMR